MDTVRGIVFNVLGTISVVPAWSETAHQRAGTLWFTTEDSCGISTAELFWKQNCRDLKVYDKHLLGK